MLEYYLIELLFILVPIAAIVSLSKKTINLIKGHGSDMKMDTKAKHLIAVLFTSVGFCTTAFFAFQLSYPDYRGGFLNLDKGPSVPALMWLCITVPIFSLGIWVSNFPLKWIIGISTSLSISFFSGLVYYRSWTDTPLYLDPIYDSSPLEGVAAIYGCLFLLPAFILFMRYINNPQ